MPPADPLPQLEYPYASRSADRPFAEELSKAPIPPPIGPTWLALIAVTIVFMTANFAVVPLTEVFRPRDFGSVLIFYCLGISAAEGFVLAAWLAWGAGSFFKRLALHWLAVMALGAAWLLGAILTEGMRDGDIRDALEVVPFSLPLFSLAIQAPLWIARHYFGWRIVDACSDEAPPRPLAIRDIMAGTVIVALSFALARLAEGMDRSSEGWLIWAVLAPSVAGICLVSVLPVAFWMLRARSLAIGLVCIPVQAVVAIVVTIMVFLTFEPSVRLQELMYLAALVVSFATALTAAALAARAAGFRLAIGGRGSVHYAMTASSCDPRHEPA